MAVSNFVRMHAGVDKMYAVQQGRGFEECDFFAYVICE